MADLKISQLGSATTPLAGTEVVPLVQGGATKKVSVENLTAGRNVSANNLALNAVAPTWNNTINHLDLPGGVSLAANSNSSLLTQNAYVNNAADWVYSSNGRASNYYQNDGTHVFRYAVSGTAGATISWINQFEFLSNGDVKASTGNLIQGTAGKGFNFTANTPAAGMTSQLLNWYEEGSYTATVTCSASGSVTLDASFNTLSYVRIGRKVTVEGLLKFSSVSSPSGYLSISLPWTIPTGVKNSSAGSLFVNNTVSAAMNAFLSVGLQNEAAVRIYIGTGTTASATSADQMQANSEIYLSFTYFA